MTSVSVIMPAYNCERYVGPAIQSVLEQTFRDFELIIVDDGSSDSTAAVIRSYADREPERIRFIRHPVNRGVSAARNTAIRHSRGSVLMLVDADDLQHPRRLEATLEITRLTGADLVFHDCEFIDEDGRPLGRRKGYPEGMRADNALLYQLQRNHLWTSLVLIRKEADVWFDETLPNAEDFELFMRLLIGGSRLEIVREPLTKYRIHRTNISNNGIVSRQSVQTVMRRLDLERIRRLLEERHDESEVRTALAAANMWRGEPERAAALLEGNAGTFDDFFLLAVAKYQMNDLQESLRLFEQANRIRENAAAWNNIGVITFLMGGSRAEAEQCFRSALSLNADYIDAGMNLAQLANPGGDPPRLKLTERPLREQIVHSRHYKV